MRRLLPAALSASIVLMTGEPLRASEAAEHGSVASASRVKQSDIRSSTNTALDEEQLARDWGLKAEEWSRYRDLMRGPLGVYSPNLDPLTALGIEARSDKERRHYAELQARAEARRAEKILNYQRAYDAAWQRLYPTLKPVSNPSARSFDGINEVVLTGEHGRLAVFVKDQCPSCDERVKQLQAAGKAFDIYMVGSRNDDARIRQWAVRAGIDPDKVRARTITLNHDAGRWLSIGGQGSLPAIVREVNGRWVRE